MLMLGIVDEDRGDYDAAEPRIVAAREIFRQSGRGHGAMIATYHLGVVAHGRGETDRARQLWGALLDTLAVLGHACGLFEIAARLQGAAGTIESHSARGEMPERLLYERTEAQLRAALGEEAYARAQAEGRALSPDDLNAVAETVLATATMD